MWGARKRARVPSGARAVALELPLEESLLGREYLADSLQLVPQLLPD